MESVEDLRVSLEGRKAELLSELSSIEEALSAIGGTSSGGSVVSMERRERRGHRGRRRAGASRGDQALELLRRRPGQTIPEMASQMGVQPNYLYRVLPRAGATQDDQRRWYPPETAPAPTTPTPAAA